MGCFFSCLRRQGSLEARVASLEATLVELRRVTFNNIEGLAIRIDDLESQVDMFHNYDEA